MQIKFKVTVDGETKDITTNYADVMALESKFDIDASELSKRQRASWLAFLAYSALKRTGATTKSFEEWSIGLEALDPADESPNA
jgi:hypothetical protein